MTPREMDKLIYRYFKDEDVWSVDQLFEKLGDRMSKEDIFERLKQMGGKLTIVGWDCDHPTQIMYEAKWEKAIREFDKVTDCISEIVVLAVRGNFLMCRRPHICPFVMPIERWREMKRSQK